jgi:hypothetical protein
LDYREALALVISVLTEISRISVHADTLLHQIISTDRGFKEALRRTLEDRAGISIAADEIRNCRTVRDLAQRIVFVSTAREPSRVELSPFEIDETKNEGCDYQVWFGTNRRPNKTSDGKLEFSALRDTLTHYGMCRVLVPKSHKIGSVGSPWWIRVLTGTDDRLRLLSIDELDTDAYWVAMRRALQSVDIDDHDAVIFIHGYNVSFVDAALRAAQIGFDLSIKGAMTFFSWPSQGTTSGYMADEATIEASEAAIAQFLTDVVTRSNARAVHIIAHSMGNRGVLRAVTRIAANAEEQSRVPFHQIILAAPDIDVDVFQQLCNAYARVSLRVCQGSCRRGIRLVTPISPCRPDTPNVRCFWNRYSQRYQCRPHNAWARLCRRG